MILEGTGKGLLDSLIAEGGAKSRDLSWILGDILLYGRLGGLGVIGMQLNFMAIPTSLEEIFLHSLVRIYAGICT